MYSPTLVLYLENAFISFSFLSIAADLVASTIPTNDTTIAVRRHFLCNNLAGGSGLLRSSQHAQPKHTHHQTNNNRFYHFVLVFLPRDCGTLEYASPAPGSQVRHRPEKIVPTPTIIIVYE